MAKPKQKRDKNNPSRKVFQIRVTPDTHAKFKSVADANNTTASLLIRDFINEYIKENEG